MKKMLILPLLLLLAPAIKADKNLIWFHITETRGDFITVEPLLPAKFEFQKISGDTPATTVFSCSLESTVVDDRPVNVFKCGSTKFEMRKILLVH